jgi:acyl-CoA thioester hydrolase
VHFSRYASLLETALLETLESAGAGLAALGAFGVELVVTELRINYLAPARFRDVLTGAVDLEHVGGARLRGRGSILRENLDGGRTRLADGVVSLASVAVSTGRPTPLPASVRGVWKGLMSHA